MPRLNKLSHPEVGGGHRCRAVDRHLDWSAWPGQSPRRSGNIRPGECSRDRLSRETHQAGRCPPASLSCGGKPLRPGGPQEGVPAACHFRISYSEGIRSPFRDRGCENARKILGVYGRPLVLTTVKPKVGLVPVRRAAVAESSSVRRPRPDQGRRAPRDVFREGGERPVPRFPAR